MIWKLFFGACISGMLISFPQNIIGCGPDVDPYDYYTSFFQIDPDRPAGYRPFYYTGMRMLYDEAEPVNLLDQHIQAWAAYTKGQANTVDVGAVLGAKTGPQLQQLAALIQANDQRKVVRGWKDNRFARFLQTTRDAEAVRYLRFAKKAETSAAFESDDYWTPPTRVKSTMRTLITEAQTGWKASKNAFIKQRWAYQVLRLQFYNEQYRDVLNGYNQYSAGVDRNTVIYPLMIALKAGAMFRTKQYEQAAYLYSQAFGMHGAKRVSNYYGFVWSIDREKPRATYLRLCQNAGERATMLALFAMSSTADETNTIRDVYREAPAHDVLRLLVSREINKLEETYLTPRLRKQPGGNLFYFSWESENTSDSALKEKESQALSLGNTLWSLANARGPQAAFLQASAAYVAYMAGDYRTAQARLDEAQQLNPSEDVNDQIQLTRLLTALSQTHQLDYDTEQKLLPSIQWLHQKASQESSDSVNWNDRRPWQKMYRDFMASIMAKRYRSFDETDKELLCVGSGERIMMNSENDDYMSTLNQIRREFDAKQAEALYNTLAQKPKNPFLEFIIANNVLKAGRIAEFVGTAYVREQKFKEAIDWYKKCKPEELAVATDPFVDELYDFVDIPSGSPLLQRCTSKLQFAEAMAKLQQEVSQPTATAQTQYRYALGLYNYTYYGPAWMLQDYYRSGVDGYRVTSQSSAFHMNYYGAIPAEAQFAEAMRKSSDPEFKARCVFMMARCAQKQFKRPSYDEFGYNNWDKYELAEKQFYAQFTKNPHFKQLKEDYGQTKFYQQAVNWCAYLADYAQKK